MNDYKRITNIEKQKKNSKRYNIYIDGEFAFSVHEDVIVAYRLMVNKVINEAELKMVLIEEEKNKIWQKALKYLGYKSRTEAEVKKYLQKDSYDQALIDTILIKLKENKFLNDYNYAKQFVNQRTNFNPKGKKLLALEMKYKGLKAEAIDHALESIDEEQEYVIAKELVERKEKQLIKEDWQQTKNKIGNFLQRRGFSYDVIIRVINNYKDLNN